MPGGFLCKVHLTLAWPPLFPLHWSSCPSTAILIQGHFDTAEKTSHYAVGLKKSITEYSAKETFQASSYLSRTSPHLSFWHRGSEGRGEGWDEGSSTAVGQGWGCRRLRHQGIGKMKASDIRHAVGVRVCFTQCLVIFKNNVTFKCSHFQTLTSK